MNSSPDTFPYAHPLDLVATLEIRYFLSVESHTSSTSFFPTRDTAIFMCWEGSQANDGYV